jgi:preprotein translocase subunit SecG
MGSNNIGESGACAIAKALQKASGVFHHLVIIIIIILMYVPSAPDVAHPSDWVRHTIAMHPSRQGQDRLTSSQDEPPWRW